MNTSPDLAGMIRVQLRYADGRVCAVDIRSTRPQNTAAVFIGRDAGEVPALIGTVYALCGKAQTIAALMAIEDALGVTLSPTQARARDALRLAEMLTQTMMRTCLGWPRLMGLAQDPAPVRRCLLAEATLEQALFGGPDWKTPGGTDFRPDLNAALLVFENVQGSVNDLLGAKGLANDMQAWLVAQSLQSFGALAPDSDPEQGALMRQWSAQPVRRIRARYGAGLAARLRAGLNDLRAISDVLAQVLHEGRTDTHDVKPALDRCGTAQVETVRGTLRHQVIVQHGRITAYQIDAPTEANFHSDGVVPQGLLGADATDIPALTRAAELHVLAIDPCVETHVEICYA